MKNNTALRISDSQRPLFQRVARKWYSWAGVSMTFFATYLAFDGQLRLSPVSRLSAAPPDASPGEVSWKAAKPAAASKEAPKEASKTVWSGPSEAHVECPDVFAILAKNDGTGTARAREVAKAYAANRALQPANYQEPVIEESPKILLPTVPPVPDKPVESEKTLGQTPATDPKGTVDPLAPRPLPNIPLPMPPRRAELPALPGLNNPPKPEGEGATLPQARPVDKTVVQQGETIPVMPKKEGKVDPSATPKSDPTLIEPAEQNNPSAAEVDSFKESERLLYNAAQNAVQLKNYSLAIERYEQLLRARPNLIYVRAEYAGILSRAGEFRRAIAVYQELINLAITSKIPPQQLTRFRVLLGDALVSAREYRAAILQYAEAVRALPNEPEYAVRLGRAYIFENDIIRASLVYDRYLSMLRPEDEKAPAALGIFLVELDRPEQALPFLLARKKYYERKLAAKEKDGTREIRESDLLDVYTGLVRTYARLGERTSAMEMINEMANKATDNSSARLVLADILLSTEEFELAAQVYNQVLTQDPSSGAALIGLARVFVEMYQPAQARKILDSFIPAPAQQRAYLMAYASYHQLIGEYIEAKQLYRDILRRNENDHEVRFALGRLYDYIKEWEKAKAEFAKIPPTGILGRQARLSFASTLASQRKFDEAGEVARVLIQDDPQDSAGIAAVVRHLSKAGKHEQAIGIARGYLASNPRSELQAVNVRLALARALLDAGRHLDAAREYEISLSRPAGRRVEAYYGLARASERLGNQERAQQLFGYITALPGGEIRNKMMLADQYSADFDDVRVLDLCNSVRMNEAGDNLAVLIRLADAQQRMSRQSGNPADCFATCQTILNLSPTNVRGHLSMARSFAVAQNYRKASAQYDQLILIDPEFTIPPRERARVLYSDHQYSAARQQYSVMLQVTPDDVVISSMNLMAAQNPKLRHAFTPYLSGKMVGAGLRSELQRLGTSSDEEIRLAAQRLIADYDATLAWQQPFTMEREAKELKDYRRFGAIPVYQSLIEFEKTNTEALFDLGQVYGALKYTQRALDLYSSVLQVDPTHRDAQVAAERAQADMGPKMNVSYWFFRQRGRDGRASIDRQRYTASGRLPLGDENEFLELGYSRVAYQPLDDDLLLGNIPFLHVQKRFADDRALFYGTLGVEEYENRISTRPTYDIGVNYMHSDFLTLRLGSYLENVVECGESIRQDIFRYGFYTGADYQATRLWRFGGTYRYGHYSDNNDMNMFDLYNEVSLSLAPKQLKLVQKFMYQGFREESIFPTNPPDPNNLFGMTHPYFSPNNFAMMEFRVEWWHWLSRDYFVHSNQCWYSLQYGIATDNNLVTYHNIKGILNYDVCTWLTVGAEANVFMSSQYDFYSALGFLEVRFR